MPGMWKLCIYNEDPQITDLRPELVQSLDRIRDFYDEDHFDIFVLYIDTDTYAIEDIAFGIRNRKTREWIGEIEFHPKGWNSEKELDQLTKDIGLEE